MHYQYLESSERWWHKSHYISFVEAKTCSGRNLFLHSTWQAGKPWHRNTYNTNSVFQQTGTTIAQYWQDMRLTINDNNHKQITRNILRHIYIHWRRRAATSGRPNHSVARASPTWTKHVRNGSNLGVRDSNRKLGKKHVGHSRQNSTIEMVSRCGKEVFGSIIVVVVNADNHGSTQTPQQV